MQARFGTSRSDTNILLELCSQTSLYFF